MSVRVGVSKSDVKQGGWHSSEGCRCRWLASVSQWLRDCRPEPRCHGGVVMVCQQVTWESINLGLINRSVNAIPALCTQTHSLCCVPPAGLEQHYIYVLVSPGALNSPLSATLWLMSHMTLLKRTVSISMIRDVTRLDKIEL